MKLDSAFTLQLILNAKVDSHSMCSLLFNWRALMHHSWFCKIRRIYGEKNSSDDDVARLCLSCSLGHVFF